MESRAWSSLAKQTCRHASKKQSKTLCGNSLVDFTCTPGSLRDINGHKWHFMQVHTEGWSIQAQDKPGDFLSPVVSPVVGFPGLPRAIQTQRSKQSSPVSFGVSPEKLWSSVKMPFQAPER